jgi:hypothetical protein
MRGTSRTILAVLLTALVMQAAVAAPIPSEVQDAEVALRAGDRGRAADLLRQALTKEPKLQLARSAHPAELVELLAEVRRELPGDKKRSPWPFVLAGGAVAAGGATAFAVATANEAPKVGPIRVEPDEAPLVYTSTMRFSVDASDADGEDLRYEWKLGEANATAMGPSVSYSFKAAPGPRTITVTVSDKKHAVTVEHTLEVRDVSGIWTGNYGGQAFTVRLNEDRSGAVRGSFESPPFSGEVGALRPVPTRTFEMFFGVVNRPSFKGVIDASANRITGTATLPTRANVPFEMSR